MARTTVTLEPEAEAAIRRVMDERGIGFKEAINTLIVESPSAGAQKRRKPFRTPTHPIGFRVPLDHASTLIGELEDIELLRKRDLGK